MKDGSEGSKRRGGKPRLSFSSAQQHTNRALSS
jgi:hypothetical protein